MNIPLFTVSPLPYSALHGELRPRADRHLIGVFAPDPGRLQHFNELLERIGTDHPHVDFDQLATAARELIDAAPDNRVPSCIRDRIRRAGAIDMMHLDPDWDIPAAGELAAVIAMEYLHGHDRLTPPTLPIVGWLDGAVMIEVLWPALADEVYDYVEFCRLRRTEAGLRGESRLHFGFTRDQFDDARLAERLWQEHCRQTGRTSYLANGTQKRFQVH